jgi:hypothetical protein
MNQTLRSWWQLASINIQNYNKKKLNSLIMLTAWSIWKERSSRVFENKFKPIQQIIREIKAEAIQ